MPRGPFRASITTYIAIALAAALSLYAVGIVHAADGDILQRGDAAITAFSGTAPSKAAGPSAEPLDRLFINQAGPSLTILNLNKPGQPSGTELADAPVKLTIKASDIGQVFGTTIGARAPGMAPDVYATASSLYGLQIVADGPNGSLIRRTTGGTGSRWMPGQFGLEHGGGPGSVWKIDGRTGAVSLFSTITSGKYENAGPGLAGVAFDAVARQVYVANLETGLIHRLDMDGRELSVFDHGLEGRAFAGLDQVPDDPRLRMDISSKSFSSEKPETWGYAALKRRVVAVSVHSGRLFYSVADGPTIWSVGIGPDGAFADDARLELEVRDTPDSSAVTAIDFDADGRLYIAQRGRPAASYDYVMLARPAASVVYRYSWDKQSKTWNRSIEEFATGMPAPHRATNGGLALSYGLTNSGASDYGRCRQTIWSTSEKLLDSKVIYDGLQGTPLSAAVDASLAGSRSGSAALQGDFEIVSSPLSAPTPTWFVDADGKPADTSIHGVAGQVAIYAPCDDTDAPRVTPQPRSFPGVVITKVCGSAPLGGSVTCRITLKNTGVSLAGPVGFTDATTILAGPSKGAPLLITSAVPDGADWACTPQPTASFGCSLPALSLPPTQSRSVDVTVETAGLVLSGNSGFRNCASLDLPWSGIACAEQTTQITVTKSAPASCVPGAPCAFQLSISNNGSQPFSGPVLVSDSMFVNGAGAPVAAPIVSIAPALGCGPDPAAIPFSCAAPMTLAAGQTKTVTMTVIMPAAPANYWAQNCMSGIAPGVAPPGLPPVPGSDPLAMSCAWVPLGAPAALSNLEIGKSPKTCNKLDANTVRCNYNITVANTGPSPSVVPLTLSETIPVGSTLSQIALPWSCVGVAPAVTCSTPAAQIIAPAVTLNIPVSIDFPVAQLEANACFAPNKVALTAPLGGTAANFNAADDSAAAIADAAWLTINVGGGLQIVLCDPTNLATNKVANGDCVNDGANAKCSYTVTITNTGPDPFKGQIDLKEEFSIAPTSLDVGGGFICGGAGSSRLCSHAPLDLAKNQSLTIPITATVPKGNACVLRNDATMVFPPAPTRWNGNAADDQAGASARILSPECERKTQCLAGPGERKTVSGDCACIAGYARGKAGLCVPTGTTPSDPPKGEPTCEPGDNEFLSAAGQCVCKTGYSYDANGACVRGGKPDVTSPVRPQPSCEAGPNEVVSNAGKCVCRDGFVRSDNGRCVRTPDCGRGTHLQNGKCVVDEVRCGQGDHKDPVTGRCVSNINPARECRDKGWMWTGSTCIPPVVTPPASTAPAKECPPGTIGKYPVCIPIPTPPKPPLCAKGMHLQNGTCVADEIRCNQGDHKDPATGRCVSNINPARECRDKGWTWTGSTCVAPPAKQCGPGMTGVFPNCKPIVVPKCPAGTTGAFPNCKPVVPLVPKCPPGTFGTPPKCEVPR